MGENFINEPFPEEFLTDGDLFDAPFIYRYRRLTLARHPRSRVLLSTPDLRVQANTENCPSAGAALSRLNFQKGPTWLVTQGFHGATVRLKCLFGLTFGQIDVAGKLPMPTADTPALRMLCKDFSADSGLPKPY
jgi:hypothetical protein